MTLDQVMTLDSIAAEARGGKAPEGKNAQVLSRVACKVVDAARRADMNCGSVGEWADWMSDAMVWIMIGFDNAGISIGDEVKRKVGKLNRGR